jgi:hypothetical protein
MRRHLPFLHIARPLLAARYSTQSQTERRESPNHASSRAAASSAPECLSPLAPEDIEHHTLLVSKDRTIGVAIDPDGDIQNVFNNGGPQRGAGRAITRAIETGGRTLDCFGGYLPDYYRQFGFIETGRMKFNDEFAPQNWNYERDGRPDVVFMAWRGYPEQTGENAIARTSRNASDWIANGPSKVYFDDYGAAKEASRRAAADAAGGDHSNPDAGKGQGADATGDQPGDRAGGNDRDDVDKRSTAAKRRET